MKLQFPLRLLLSLTVFAAILLAWRRDHLATTGSLAATRTELAEALEALAFSEQERAGSEKSWQEFVNDVQLDASKESTRANTAEQERNWKSRECDELVRSVRDLQTRIRGMAQDERILRILHENATRAHADLADIARFLGWSAEEETTFLMEPSWEQKFLVESARELQKGGPFKRVQLYGWQTRPLLAKGLESAGLGSETSGTGRARDGE